MSGDVFTGSRTEKKSDWLDTSVHAVALNALTTARKTAPAQYLSGGVKVTVSCIAPAGDGPLKQLAVRYGNTAPQPYDIVASICVNASHPGRLFGPEQRPITWTPWVPRPAPSSGPSAAAAVPATELGDEHSALRLWLAAMEVRPTSAASEL